MIKFFKKKFDAYVLALILDSESKNKKQISFSQDKIKYKKNRTKKDLLKVFREAGSNGRAMDSLSFGAAQEQAKNTEQEFYDYLLNFKDETHAMLSIYAKDPIVHAALSFQAADALRNGFVVNGLDEREVKKIDLEFDFKTQLKKAVFLSLVHGGCAIAFETKSEVDDKSLPINNQTFGASKYGGVFVANPEDSTADIVDERGTIDRWYVFGEEYHPSRIGVLVIDNECESASYSQKWTGKSLAQSIIASTFQHAQAKQILLSATKTKGLLTITIDSEEFWMSVAANNGDGDGVGVVSQIAGYLQKIRDEGGVIVAPVGSKVSSSTLNLADVIDSVRVFKEEVAAAAKMPVTKIFGDSVKGLNASGEGARKVYNERLADIQAALTPLIEKHYRFASGKSEISIKWNPLDEPTEAEVWDNNLKKSKVITELRSAGIIDTIDARDWIREDQSLGLSELEELKIDLDSQQATIDDNV